MHGVSKTPARPVWGEHHLPLLSWLLICKLALPLGLNVFCNPASRSKERAEMWPWPNFPLGSVMLQQNLKG